MAHNPTRDFDVVFELCIREGQRGHLVSTILVRVLYH